MAGGYKMFGPTYNTTPYVRTGYEGFLNGLHKIDVAGLNGETELAGKFATVGANGVKLASAGGQDAVGLFREDLGDMMNASERATFYFRGGEYYVSIARTGLSSVSDIAVGDQITCDAEGKLIKLTDPNTQRALGVVTHVGTFPLGNMYANAGTAANGGDFVGFIMFI